MTLHKHLKALRKNNGLSQQEVATALGYKSFTTIQKWEDGSSLPPVKRLEQLADLYDVDVEGLIDSQPRVQIPLLGTVRGGEPIYASEAFETVELVPDHPEEHFYLRVVGDSMQEARIRDGDLILVHRQSHIDNGAIGVVIIEDEATVKYVYQSPEGIKLVPANPAYSTKIYTLEDIETLNIKVLGKVVANHIQF